MALIFCRECGNKISDQAPTCPQCGVSQNIPKNSKSNSGWFAIIIGILILGLGGYFYFNQENTLSATSETKQERVDMADRLLAKNCEFVTNLSTEYIKNDALAAFFTALGGSKCDCIREKLREKLADKYTLPQLQEFEKTPGHFAQEIRNLIEANNEELKACFPLINEVKDAVLE